jgi:NAD(P)H-hydrate epimerase
MSGLSREQIRGIDRYAMEKLGVPGVVLMENAGRGAADEIEKFLGGVRNIKIAVVAGAGNNGGDGFVIARHLAMRGATVATFLATDASKISGDAAVNLAILRSLGHDIRELSAEMMPAMGGLLRGFDLVVDAVGGTGVRGPLRGEQAEVVRAINAAGVRVAAVDIPTGLDCDTGDAPSPAVRAAITVTMAAMKKGFDAPQARQYTGEIRLVDIGVPAEWILRQIE